MYLPRQALILITEYIYLPNSGGESPEFRTVFTPLARSTPYRAVRAKMNCLVSGALKDQLWWLFLSEMTLGDIKEESNQSINHAMTLTKRLAAAAYC